MKLIQLLSTCLLLIFISIQANAQYSLVVTNYSKHKDTLIMSMKEPPFNQTIKYSKPSKPLNLEGGKQYVFTVRGENYGGNCKFTVQLPGIYGAGCSGLKASKSDWNSSSPKITIGTAPKNNN